jgi:hypothetical protein
LTCDGIDKLLTSGSHAEGLPLEAEEHLRSCSDCRTLASAVRNASAVRYQLDPVVLQRVRAPILSSVSRVRLLAPPVVLGACFFLVFATAAMTAGKILGIYGLRALTPLARVLIFATLIVLAGAAATAIARCMRPGAKTFGAWLLFFTSFIAIEAVFFLLFHDYSAGKFISRGIECLKAGLCCAIATGLLASLLLRRGYVVAPVSTGAAVGTLAGLAGLATLELHCPILTIPHVVVWHAAVLVVSSGAGVLAGCIARRVSSGA